MRATYRASLTIDTKNPPALPKKWQPIHTTILLWIHILGYPTIEHLAPLVCGHKLSEDYLSHFLKALYHHGLVRRVPQADLENPLRRLPIAYTDSTKGRRILEMTCGIPHRPVSEKLPRSNGKLPHNIGVADDLLAVTKTARLHTLSVHYTCDFTPQQAPVAIDVPFIFDAMSYTRTLRPDATTALVRDRIYYDFWEHDCGSETLDSQDMSKETVLRKLLLYACLLRNPDLQAQIGVDGFRVRFVVDGKKHMLESSERRITNIIGLVQKYIPRSLAGPSLFQFVSRQRMMEARDDISKLEWTTGNGRKVLHGAFVMN